MKNHHTKSLQSISNLGKCVSGVVLFIVMALRLTIQLLPSHYCPPLPPSLHPSLPPSIPPPLPARPHGWRCSALSASCMGLPRASPRLEVWPAVANPPAGGKKKKKRRRKLRKGGGGQSGEKKREKEPADRPFVRKGNKWKG